MMKKVFLGLGLILAAAFLLFKDYLHIPNLDVPLWILICGAVFITGAIINLIKKDYPGTIGSLAILFIIVNSYYEWLNIWKGSWIAALVLGFLGLQFLFKKDENN